VDTTSVYVIYIDPLP